MYLYIYIYIYHTICTWYYVLYNEYIPILCISYNISDPYLKPGCFLISHEIPISKLTTPPLPRDPLWPGWSPCCVRRGLRCRWRRGRGTPPEHGWRSVASGNLTYGKSPYLMGKVTINVTISMAIFNGYVKISRGGELWGVFASLTAALHIPNTHCQNSWDTGLLG